MREIKFKAYKLSTKSFVYSNIDFRNIGLLADAHSKDLAWVQYTGFKDKNGVDIYEGDIVLISHPAWTETGVISFEKGSFIFTQNKDYRKDQVIVQLYSTQFEIWELEVVGNIYENKELLK